VEEAAMDQPRGYGVRDLLWLLAWGLASSLWCWTAGHRLGPTYDEPVHIRLGLEYWRAGNHRDLVAGGGTMPLPVDVFTLPLYLWERWQGVPFNLNNDLGRMLPVARAAMLAFWWLLLFYTWRAGYRLAGPWGGRLAVALVACEPVLLGHASLATADVALSACLLALVYHYRTGREENGWRRVALPVFWFGMTFLAKANGPVFAAVCLLVVEAQYLLQVWPVGSRRIGRQLRRSITTLVIVAGGGLLLAAVGAGDDRDPYRPLTLAWAPEGAAGRAITWLAERAHSMSNAYHCMQFQLHHNRGGHGNIYLLGETRPGPFWYYFPLTLAIKLTLSMLSLPVLLFVLRPRALANWACLAATALLLVTLGCKVQLGIRLVLPLVVLGAVGLAAALVRGCQLEKPGWRRHLLAGGAMAAVLWSASAALSVWPHGLCYTNELWGGTAEGYRALSDSNYDWGQGLPELAHWQRQHALASMDVWYYGTDPALFRLPLRELSWNALAAAGPETLRAKLHGHFFAASTTMLYGAGSHDPAAVFLRTCQPVARTATFLIYDFTR
jgi:hypothetical protein